MRVILWTIAAIVSSTGNAKFLLWQNDPHFAYRHNALDTFSFIRREFSKAHLPATRGHSDTSI